ncbi:MAG TPA: RDD family protein [Actinomycetota bacterium]|nr:RDD family protein [Actinomycetota bacterium]
MAYLVVGLVDVPRTRTERPPGTERYLQRFGLPVRADEGFEGLFADYPLASGSTFVANSTYVAIGAVAASVTGWLLLLSSATLRQVAWVRIPSAFTCAVLAGFWLLLTVSIAQSTVSGLGQAVMFTTPAGVVSAVAAWTAFVRRDSGVRPVRPGHAGVSGGSPGRTSARIAARTLDVLLYVFVVAPLVGVLHALLSGDDAPEVLGTVHALLAVGVAIAFEAEATAQCGQTVGKMITGVRVVGYDGDLVTRPRALIRVVTSAVGLVPPLGFVIYGPALADARRRGVHDRLARSSVVPGPIFDRGAAASVRRDRDAVADGRRSV